MSNGTFVQHLNWSPRVASRVLPPVRTALFTLRARISHAGSNNSAREALFVNNMARQTNTARHFNRDNRYAEYCLYFFYFIDSRKTYNYYIDTYINCIIHTCKKRIFVRVTYVFHIKTVCILT